MIDDCNTPHPNYALIKILIVDDMDHVRQELRQLLELSDGIKVIGEAGDGQEAIEKAESLHPDVVIMDLEMPILDGIQATRQIKKRKLARRVVMLSVHSEPEEIERAMQAGTDAFIQKGSPYSTLIESIHPTK
jgi:DNA-binding NarL/FixJ family response regulator